MNVFIIVFIPLIMFCSSFSFAQQQNLYLVSDPETKYNTSNAINILLNFNFKAADSSFNLIKKNNPEHPLGYFLIGYKYYWKLQINEDNKIYDDSLINYLDSTIYFAEKKYKNNKDDFEAIFFFSLAYGIKGRLLSDREKWAASVFAGRNALVYLDKGRVKNELSDEFLFGDALFNYYAEWIPENYKAFKPVMWFFPKGSKQKGLDLLKIASNVAYYTRIEAQYFRLRILLYEEKDYSEAIPLAKYMIETYPNNPIFQRLYMRLMFSTGNYPACEKKAYEILENIKNNKLGYEEVSGRFAAFFIGWINMNRNKAISKEYFQKSVEYCEKVGALKMNYYFYALSALAKYANEAGDKKMALDYYDKIKSNADRKHEMYKEAKKFIREND